MSSVYWEEHKPRDRALDAEPDPRDGPPDERDASEVPSTAQMPHLSTAVCLLVFAFAAVFSVDAGHHPSARSRGSSPSLPAALTHGLLFPHAPLVAVPPRGKQAEDGARGLFGTSSTGGTVSP